MVQDFGRSAEADIPNNLSSSEGINPLCSKIHLREICYHMIVKDQEFAGIIRDSEMLAKNSIIT